MRRAREHAQATGASCLALETADDNHAAQQLYESEGWQHEAGRHYVLAID